MPLSRPLTLALGGNGVSGLTAGVLSVDSTTVDSATVSWTNASGAQSISAQLQGSDDSVSWSNIAAATSSPTTESSLTAGVSRYYRVAYSATGFPTVFSNVVSAVPALLAYWPLNGDYLDASPSGFDGTAVASPSFGTWRPKRSRQAVTLNGSTQWVDVSSHVGSLDGLTTGVISCWFKTDDLAHALNLDQCIFSIGDTDAQTNVRLMVGQSTGNYADETLEFSVISGGSNTLRMFVRITERFLNDGRWHHVAAIVNGSSNHFLVDGYAYTPSFTDGNGTTSAFTNVATADNAFIGKADFNSAGTSRQFGGEIAELRIYSAAITDANLIAETFRPYTDLYWTASQTAPYTDATVKSEVDVTGPGASTPLENDLTTWRFRHHTRMWWDGNDTLFMAHSIGATNEDANGQHCVGWRSTDKGATWTGPEVLVPRQSTFSATAPSDSNGSRFLFPSSFVEVDGTLYLVSCLQTYVSGNRTTLAFIANSYASDGTVGSPFRITEASYTPFSGFDEIAYDATLGPAVLAAVEPTIHWGEYSGGAGVIDNGLYRIVESSVAPFGSNEAIQTWRDVTTGTIRRQIWTRSGDAGGALNSFTDPMPTGIPDGNSASAIIRNSEGKLVLVGNVSSNRTPLYLATADAGSREFDTVIEVRDGTDANIYAGTHKGASWAYPDIIQIGNYYYLSYSQGKERVWVNRMLVPGLTDNDNDVSGADFYRHSASILNE